MSAQTETTNSISQRRNGALVGGAFLISIGLFSLLENVFHFSWGLYFLPMLAVIFLASGIITRRPGLLIPGGILAGIGAGAILVEEVFYYLGDPMRGGVFMLAFAAGWLVITLASLLIGRVMLWPLIPSAFMGLLGIALLGAHTGLLSVVSLGWPILLIVIGLYLVLRRQNS